ncbi:PLP-dependent aminotransferase family protein [Vreelandella neptunia]|uniref:PLP-dependent aminotransferase family protein n=1 Tax=Vreelandella neptunia TaxID=115551 RepID=A0ABZ0YJ54_9GAMM|nr:PLP-dependent aminotransferase family protein [Halomonas neptunia]MDN3560633.1 PLP-dependent aminotransferase family protein [Halomonas neptunia]WQH12133.1 PLP-dependent aminotransferase family protein [Halomonas neptunia]
MTGLDSQDFEEEMCMTSLCLEVDPNAGPCLQEQLRKTLLEAIRMGSLPSEDALPSCRKLSQQLGISRNTVAIVYEKLVEDGYLISRPRSGYYLHPDYNDPQSTLNSSLTALTEHNNGAISAPNWHKRITQRPTNYQGILKPGNWSEYAYPFIYGQLDTRLFPLAQWRDVSRRLLSSQRDKPWLRDRVDQDDPLLIEQLRKRILPRRGIFARSEEILITMGTQNALYLIAQLLCHQGTCVALESPGYREAMNVFAQRGASLQYQTVDMEGMCLEGSQQCDYLYVMPSHQVPTGVTMSRERREALLAQLHQRDQIVIEDDYDAEIHGDQFALPALKASAQSARIIYMGSLSKALSPGLRMGYVVADAEVIDELRALRRMMYRHPPAALQHQLAQFISQGYYERYLKLHVEEIDRRRDAMRIAIDQALPGCLSHSSNRSSAFWMEADASIDTQRLAWHAAQRGVLIEPGFQHFFDAAPPRRFFRLGFGAIKRERIDPGIQRLGLAYDNALST